MLCINVMSATQIHRRVTMKKWSITAFNHTGIKDLILCMIIISKLHERIVYRFTCCSTL